jgi:hypothetical protein
VTPPPLVDKQAADPCRRGTETVYQKQQQYISLLLHLSTDADAVSQQASPVLTQGRSCILHTDIFTNTALCMECNGVD